MAAKSGTAAITFTYTKPGGGTASINKTITLAYDELESGTVDIPLGATAAFTASLAFGAVTKATGLLVENNSGQDLQFRLNGVTGDHHVADGGAMLLAMASAPGATPVSSFTITGTTAQAADGEVSYIVLGPV
jgi:hypothetical protein